MLKPSSLDLGSQDGGIQNKSSSHSGATESKVQSGEGAWHIRKRNKGWYLLEHGVQERKSEPDSEGCGQDFEMYPKDRRSFK